MHVSHDGSSLCFWLNFVLYQQAGTALYQVSVDLILYFVVQIWG